MLHIIWNIVMLEEAKGQNGSQEKDGGQTGQANWQQTHS